MRQHGLQTTSMTMARSKRWSWFHKKTARDDFQSSQLVALGRFDVLVCILHLWSGARCFIQHSRQARHSDLGVGGSVGSIVLQIAKSLGFMSMLPPAKSTRPKLASSELVPSPRSRWSRAGSPASGRPRHLVKGGQRGQARGGDPLARCRCLAPSARPYPVVAVRGVSWGLGCVNWPVSAWRRLHGHGRG